MQATADTGRVSDQVARVSVSVSVEVHDRELLRRGSIDPVYTIEVGLDPLLRNVEAALCEEMRQGRGLTDSQQELHTAVRHYLVANHRQGPGSNRRVYDAAKKPHEGQ